MNRKLWIVPAAIVLVGAVAGYVKGQGEPYTYAYRNLVEGWPRFSPAMQDRIRGLMADGKLSEWEWQSIEMDALSEAKFFGVSSEDRPDLETARNRLIALIGEKPKEGQ